jgi:predicted PurR-regulated permease PerM
VFWWARFIFFSAVAAFFLAFGIGEMARAYEVKHPSEFLASFFSSSFIILISGTLLVAFIWKMVLRLKEMKKELNSSAPPKEY